MSVDVRQPGQREMAREEVLRLAQLSQVIGPHLESSTSILAQAALHPDPTVRAYVVHFFSRAVSGGVLSRTSIAAVSELVAQLHTLYEQSSECEATGRDRLRAAEELLRGIAPNVFEFLVRAHNNQFRMLEAHFLDSILPALGDRVLLKFLEATQSRLIPLTDEQVLAILDPAIVQLVDDFCILPHDAVALPSAGLIRIRAGVIHSPQLDHILAHESTHLLAGIGSAEIGNATQPGFIFKRGLRMWDTHAKELFGSWDEAATESITAQVMGTPRCAHIAACAQLDRLCSATHSEITFSGVKNAYFESGSSPAAMPNWSKVFPVLARHPVEITPATQTLARESFMAKGVE